MVEHIKDLLKLHDCVIIPGLGGLIGHYEPARRNLGSGTMAPPMKRVAFNKVLSQNDGLLIHRVATEESVSWEEAKEKVNVFRKEVETALKDHGSYLFAGIGKLTYNEDRNLQFYPILKENLLLDTFGMPLIVAQPIQRIKEEAVKVADTIEIGEATENESSKEVHEPQLIPNSDIQVYRPWIFRAAAMIGLAFLLTTATLNLVNNGISSDELTLFPKGADPVSLLAITADSELNEVEAEQFSLYEVVEAEEIAEPDIIISDEEAIPVSPMEFTADDPYFVIIGSFLDKARLNREISNMQKKGYTIQTLEGPNGYVRVGLVFDGSIDNRASTLNSIRDTVNADAWMING